MASKRQAQSNDTAETSSNALSALFLGSLAVVTLVTANVNILYNMWYNVVQSTGIATEVCGNLLYVIFALVGVLLIDYQTVIDMFSKVSFTEKCPPNILVTLFGLYEWERAICNITVTVNWLTSHGLVYSGMKLLMQKPLVLDSVKMSSDIFHDLLSGDLPLNPLIRTWTWETVYGLSCGLYLASFFALSAAHRLRFNLKSLAPKAVGYMAVYLTSIATTGLLRSHADWLGPSEGVWLIFTHACILWLGYKQWQKLHPCPCKNDGAEGKADASLVEPSAILLFADRMRGYKPITVFVLTSILSVVYAHATFLYTPIVIASFFFYWKSHRMDRGWNKVLLVLNVAHYLLHFFVHSYRTLEDQPLLWIDKLVHFLFAVVAWQQFREKRELLSKDPLVKLFNYINMFIFIPGDIASMYIAGFHGPNEIYLWHLINWGGYCLSTGTALAFVNNDVEEDSAPDSARRHIVEKPGVTGHGIQMVEAISFAVLYIVFSGGSPQAGVLIEYVYDYASHLYIGYGAM